MFKTFSELLLHKKLVFEEGRISLFNIPMGIIPIHFMVYIQKELEKNNLKNLVYYAAKDNGAAWFESMDKNYGLKIKDINKWGPDLISLAGWGKVKVTKKKDSEKSLLVTLENSSFAKVYGKSLEPVDHFFRGMVCGAWSYAYKDNLEAVETKCVSKGDNLCEFLIMPKKNFDLNNSKISSQLTYK